MPLRTYAVVIESAKRNFSAYVPDLPSCVATGRTADEALNHIAAAIEFHLRSMAAAGDPMPTPPTCKVAYVAAPFDAGRRKHSSKPVPRRGRSAAAASIATLPVRARPRR